jgi:hypothetical protein
MKILNIKNMTNIAAKFAVLLLIFLLILPSCGEKSTLPQQGPNEQIIILGWNKTINENPSNGYTIGEISASSLLEGDITYSISSQSPENAFQITDEGKVLVLDPTLFDFEERQTLVFSARASVGSQFNDAECIITLTDVFDPDFQKDLDNGKTPWQILEMYPQLPKDSLYGKSFKGGIIVDIYGSLEKCFIAHPTAISATYNWGCKGTHLEADGGWTEGQNENILSNCSEQNIAARICSNLTTGGYNDWLLPSVDRMNTIGFYFKLNKIPLIIDEQYWTSTEVSNSTDEAEAILFVGTRGLPRDVAKDEKLRIWPVRIELKP